MRACVVAACGRMGEAVRRAIADEAGIELVAAFEAPGHPQLGSELAPGVVLGDDAKAALAGCDVAIDFSVPAATLAGLRAAADAGVAYVTGTTGFSDAASAELVGFADRTPVIHAPNFSTAVNVLTWLTRLRKARREDLVTSFERALDHRKKDRPERALKSLQLLL